jgi:hypothetical protein
MWAKKLNEKFPALVLAMRNTWHNVTCFNDSMHGSTIKAESSLKTQIFDSILVNSTILTPLSIPWCGDEACLVYWVILEKTHGYISLHKMLITKFIFMYIHWNRIPQCLHNCISTTFFLCVISKLIICMSRSVRLVSSMLMKAWICDLNTFTATL